MLFHFQSGAGTTFKDDHRSYFEDRFRTLKKFMENYEQNRALNDTVEVRVSLNRNLHHKKGDLIQGKATIFYPGHGRFHAETKGSTLKACADDLVDKLKPQIQKFKAHHA
ncbi:MAG TPA: HPF/RaiA family ribosome-associated protein [Candidatus Gracilibacteria bacterium]